MINSGKLLSENPQAHPEKVHSPLKIQKVQVTLFLTTLKMFQPPLSPHGGGGHYVIAILKNQNKSKIKKIEISRLSIFRVELMFFVFTYKPLYAVVFLASQSVIRGKKHKSFGSVIFIIGSILRRTTFKNDHVKP